MRKFIGFMFLIGAGVWAAPLAAQQTCAAYTVIVNSPEDKLMLAVNGADTPQDQITALEKFSQDHADSKYMPCVDEYLTRAYVKLQQYDKAIAAGEKALAAGYLDAAFQENLLQAYIGGGQAPDAAFQLIAKAPAEIKTENTPARTSSMSDADFAKAQKDATQQATNETEFFVYAFFQLFPRVTDPKTKISDLDQFVTAYPGAAKQQAAVIDYQYASAYTALNQVDQADEYAEKAVAADPNNIEALNLLAFDYAIVKRTNFDRAVPDAKKVIELAPSMKKPQGVSDEQFKGQQDNLLGMAHLSLGYVLLVRAGSGKRYATHSQMAPAISELESASGLLSRNPRLQGGALFYLGSAYEEEYPAEHREAAEALEKSAALESPWRGMANALLEKVNRARR